MSDFIHKSPTLDNYWRSIILFGRNVASYKFALAQTLLEFRDKGSDLIKTEDLASPFARHICTHIKNAPKQTTSPSSKFLDACKAHNEGNLSEAKIVEITSRLGFTNVIDAFHIVNQGEIHNRFFLDERLENKGIRLTENLFELFENDQSKSLSHEVEARWRLVETAWDLNVSRNLIAVEYDLENQLLFTERHNKRIDITSSRDALNGYQKGKFFHCFDNISVAANDVDLADVDHFFPWKLKEYGIGSPIDGVWNLVLSCRHCNRGRGGKSAKIPSLNLLYRLKARNDFLIGSHHPLRETLIAQTGKSETARNSFLQKTYDEATSVLIHTWEPVLKDGPFF